VRARSSTFDGSNVSGNHSRNGHVTSPTSSTCDNTPIGTPHKSTSLKRSVKSSRNRPVPARRANTKSIASCGTHNDSAPARRNQSGCSAGDSEMSNAVTSATCSTVATKYAAIQPPINHHNV